jgi:hypothetical protein
MSTDYKPRIITGESLAQHNGYAEHISTETDDEIIERMRTKFTILEDMANAVKRGDVRSLIVAGAAGSGKSFGIETVLRKHDAVALLAEQRKPYEIVKGHMSGIMLYKKLWDNRHEKNVLVLDDCDAIFSDESSLNVLKTALDSGSRREISWNTDSRFLKDEGIPNSFEYLGGCIFATNLSFNSTRSAKLTAHLKALESRSHYFDIGIDTNREKMLRIKQVVMDGMLSNSGFSDEQVEEMLSWIDENKMRMRELSLRTCVKLGELVKSMPRSWRDVASMTLLTRR